MRLLGLTAVAALILGGAGLPARAAVNTDGDLVGTFDGGMMPTSLPRSEPRPVAVRVSGDVRTASGEATPQLRTISVAINGQGRLFDRGLPVCDVASIQPADEVHARAACGDSIVGHGHVTVEARLPTQPSFTVEAGVLVFNGPARNGRKLILAQVYAPNPPGAFVLTFTVVRRKSGVFGTVMRTSLPVGAQAWAYLTHFDMTLHRLYTYRGVRRSYVSAACTAPRGFRSALFPFARATYGFADGRNMTISITRRCTVRGE